MSKIHPQQLYEWCRIPFQELESHPQLKLPFRLVRDSAEMGRIMAGELVDEIRAAPIHLTYGGWGQDGHIAYNQARRNPYSPSEQPTSLCRPCLSPWASGSASLQTK
ncbi:hypothetical protein ES703_17891 [subsurface metagenome]